MGNLSKIKTVYAQEILDSRGNPTLEATVILESGACGTACVPSGASCGIHEALELRDGGDRFDGMGALRAVESVNCTIGKKLCGLSPIQKNVDAVMRELDGTEDKSKLGANSILGVSLACAKAASAELKLPLFRYIGGISAKKLPVPLMNVLNGGAHAGNNLDTQEFMIVPMGFKTFSEALRAGCEVYKALGRLLRADGKSTCVGDEGGYAPDLSDDSEALDYLIRAIEEAGYTKDEIKLSLDAAVSEWFDGETYRMPKSGVVYTPEQLCRKWEEMCERYTIFSIEDGMAEDDFSGWQKLTRTLGKKIRLVGDDLFVTNEKRLREGVKMEMANSILIKPNQIGTLTETLDVIRFAKEHSYSPIISHRSGETEDVTIADIAVATNAGYIKCGAPCRTERTAKYNRLLRIEMMLSDDAIF